MKNKIVECYTNSNKVNYDVAFINDQMLQLEELHMHQNVDTSAESMLLGIICSALKYYINASPEGYQNNIFSIVRSLERIYNIDDLLDEIIEIE